MIQQKAYKFRIYPTNKQIVLINKTFGCCRYAWNSWVETFNKISTEEKAFKTPKDFKKDEATEWMKEVSSAAIQQKERDFIEFKSQFFNKKRKKKIGKPSFKTRRSKQSYRLPNQKFSIEDNKIKLEKIGLVKIVLDRIIPETVKFLNATISKDKCNNYYASVLVEENIIQKEKTGKEIGIDVGIKSFAVLSDETIIDNPKFFKENQLELKKIQKHFSRKVEGSNNYYRAKIKLSKFHRKIARKREYFLHNLSSILVNSYDVIAVEDLNVAGMLKNHKLAKAIQDASWSEFFKMLTYKAKWYSKEIRKVDRFIPTSKTCSVCGYYYKDITLDIRDWICPICGTNHNRDSNAAINILNKSVRVETESQTWREHKSSLAVPVEVSIVL